jgi:hypothetical protein
MADDADDDYLRVFRFKQSNTVDIISSAPLNGHSAYIHFVKFHRYENMNPCLT